MSWLVRQSHSGFAYGQGQQSAGGHEHGYSAGPVYAVVSPPYNGYAQAKTTQKDTAIPDPPAPAKPDADGAPPVAPAPEPAEAADLEDADTLAEPEAHEGYPEPEDDGVDGVDDGYDPFGYGDYGFGYGGAQAQYRAIQEKLNAMVAAQAEITQRNEARIAVAAAALEQAQLEAWQEFQTALEDKWAAMTETMDALNAAKAAAVEARSATMATAVDDARAAILAANLLKDEATGHREQELRWAVTSVYNYDVQHALNQALTAAVAAHNGACVERNVALELSVASVEAEWAATVDSESATYDANTEEETARCEGAKAAESATLTAFKAAQLLRFAQWAQGEREALAAFVAECDEAWQWILESYCLKHGTEGVTSAGYGCTYGAGSGFGNGGYRKGIAVEEHDDILSYGQDLDIKHIQDIQGLVAHAVDFTMDGVAEEAAAQLGQADGMQALIDGAIDEARQQLEASLAQRGAASAASLDETVAGLGQDLLDGETAALAAVDADRLTYQQAVEDLREQLLWDIKEIVWRLGYTQGYAYGAHDGHDYELQAQIAQKKDEFEATVIATLQMMQNRVLAEQQAGDEAAAAARADLDGEATRLESEMEDALAAAQASFELTLTGGKDALAGEGARATTALNAFIATRLALWQEKYTYEEINAKWQEDSYYRYNLLRLLAEKQEAIDGAVAQAKADFAAAVSAEKGESTAFRAAQRDAFAQSVADTRQGLADAIAEDELDMGLAIQEREASLDAALGTQQAQLEAKMEECRQEMKSRLKEIYNYNSYDWDKSQQQDTPISPYSHEQHQAFVTKFAFYLKDVLHQYDAAIGSMGTATTAKVADYTEASQDQAEDLQLLIED